MLSPGENATLNISRNLHNVERPSISFNLGIRLLAIEFLRADVAAGRLSSALGAGKTEVPDSMLIKPLRVLSGRSDIGLRHEKAKSIPTMWEQSGEWVSGARIRALPFLGNRVHVIQTMSVDGYTRTFPLVG